MVAATNGHMAGSGFWLSDRDISSIHSVLYSCFISSFSAQQLTLLSISGRLAITTEGWVNVQK